MIFPASWFRNEQPFNRDAIQVGVRDETARGGRGRRGTVFLARSSELRYDEPRDLETFPEKLLHTDLPATSTCHSIRRQTPPEVAEKASTVTLTFHVFYSTNYAHGALLERIKIES